ncbi:MAG: VacJ family lipoprotein [Gammaproteobacteria bacterium]|nr:VacJ family lipoprotein [Gammaproteobacteria bacterium]
MEINRLKLLTRCALLILITGLITGCAATRPQDDPEVTVDPLEKPNRVFFDINETLDKHLLKPVAESYVAVTPEPVRKSITNFFDNISYLNVILNLLLQGKFDAAVAGSLRFVYNSTLGVGGLFDISTEWGVPARDEDFGQTMAVWGMDEGAYVYVPLQGPNTARNLPNFVTSYFLNPLTYVTSTILFPLSAINAVNTRANLLDETNIRDEAAVDPYTFTREAYLQQRKYLIHDGNPPVEGYDDIFEDELGGDGEGDGVLVIE